MSKSGFWHAVAISKGLDKITIKEPIVGADMLVRDIKRAMRCNRLSKNKTRIVIAGMGGEKSIGEPYRKVGMLRNLNYRWLMEVLGPMPPEGGARSLPS